MNFEKIEYFCWFFRLASVQEQRLPDARLSPTNENTPPITPTSSAAKVPERNIKIIFPISSGVPRNLPREEDVNMGKTIHFCFNMPYRICNSRYNCTTVTTESPNFVFTFFSKIPFWLHPSNVRLESRK